MEGLQRRAVGAVIRKLFGSLLDEYEVTRASTSRVCLENVRVNVDKLNAGIANTPIRVLQTSVSKIELDFSGLTTRIAIERLEVDVAPVAVRTRTHTHAGGSATPGPTDPAGRGRLPSVDEDGAAGDTALDTGISLVTQLLTGLSSTSSITVREICVRMLPLDARTHITWVLQLHGCAATLVDAASGAAASLATVASATSLHVTASSLQVGFILDDPRGAGRSPVASATVGRAKSAPSGAHPAHASASPTWIFELQPAGTMEHVPELPHGPGRPGEKMAMSLFTSILGKSKLAPSQAPALQHSTFSVKQDRDRYGIFVVLPLDGSTKPAATGTLPTPCLAAWPEGIADAWCEKCSGICRGPTPHPTHRPRPRVTLGICHLLASVDAIAAVRQTVTLVQEAMEASQAHAAGSAAASIIMRRPDSSAPSTSSNGHVERAQVPPQVSRPPKARFATMLKTASKAATAWWRGDASTPSLLTRSSLFLQRAGAAGGAADMGASIVGRAMPDGSYVGAPTPSSADSSMFHTARPAGSDSDSMEAAASLLFTSALPHDTTEAESASGDVNAFLVGLDVAPVDDTSFDVARKAGNTPKHERLHDAAQPARPNNGDLNSAANKAQGEGAVAGAASASSGWDLHLAAVSVNLLGPDVDGSRGTAGVGVASAASRHARWNLMLHRIDCSAFPALPLDAPLDIENAFATTLLGAQLIWWQPTLSEGPTADLAPFRVLGFAAVSAGVHGRRVRVVAEDVELDVSLAATLDAIRCVRHYKPSLSRRTDAPANLSTPAPSDVVDMSLDIKSASVHLSHGGEQCRLLSLHAKSWHTCLQANPSGSSVLDALPTGPPACGAFCTLAIGKQLVLSGVEALHIDVMHAVDGTDSGMPIRLLQLRPGQAMRAPAAVPEMHWPASVVAEIGCRAVSIPDTISIQVADLDVMLQPLAIRAALHHAPLIQASVASAQREASHLRGAEPPMIHQARAPTPSMLTTVVCVGKLSLIALIQQDERRRDRLRTLLSCHFDGLRCTIAPAGIDVGVSALGIDVGHGDNAAALLSVVDETLATRTSPFVVSYRPNQPHMEHAPEMHVSLTAWRVFGPLTTLPALFDACVPFLAELHAGPLAHITRPSRAQAMTELSDGPNGMMRLHVGIQQCAVVHTASRPLGSVHGGIIIERGGVQVDWNDAGTRLSIDACAAAGLLTSQIGASVDDACLRVAFATTMIPHGAQVDISTLTVQASDHHLPSIAAVGASIWMAGLQLPQRVSPILAEITRIAGPTNQATPDLVTGHHGDGAATHFVTRFMSGDFVLDVDEADATREPTGQAASFAVLEELHEPESLSLLPGTGATALATTIESQHVSTPSAVQLASPPGGAAARVGDAGTESNPQKEVMQPAPEVFGIRVAQLQFAANFSLPSSTAPLSASPSKCTITATTGPVAMSVVRQQAAQSAGMHTGWVRSLEMLLEVGELRVECRMPDMIEHDAAPLLHFDTSPDLPSAIRLDFADFSQPRVAAQCLYQGTPALLETDLSVLVAPLHVHAHGGLLDLLDGIYEHGHTAMAAATFADVVQAASNPALTEDATPAATPARWLRHVKIGKLDLTLNFDPRGRAARFVYGLPEAGAARERGPSVESLSSQEPLRVESLDDDDSAGKSGFTASTIARMLGYGAFGAVVTLIPIENLRLQLPAVDISGPGEVTSLQLVLVETYTAHIWKRELSSIVASVPHALLPALRAGVASALASSTFIVYAARGAIDAAARPLGAAGRIAMSLLALMSASGPAGSSESNTFGSVDGALVAAVDAVVDPAALPQASRASAALHAAAETLQSAVQRAMIAMPAVGVPGVRPPQLLAAVGGALYTGIVLILERTWSLLRGRAPSADLESDVILLAGARGGSARKAPTRAPGRGAEADALDDWVLLETKSTARPGSRATSSVPGASP